MLGQKIPYGIEKWDYEDVRCYLLSNSAEFRLLTRKFRNKFRLDKATQDKITYAFIASEIGANPELASVIKRICSALSISSVFLEYAVSDQLRDFAPSEFTLPIFDASDALPIAEEGFYIKVGRHTRPATVKEAFRVIKRRYRELERTSESLLVKSRSKITKKDKAIKNLALKVTLYQIIEKNIYENKTDNRDIFTTDEEYEEDYKSIVSHAIQFAAEKLSQLNKRFKDYKTAAPIVREYYYSLYRYYSLPTSREIKNCL